MFNDLVPREEVKVKRKKGIYGIDDQLIENLLGDHRRKRSH